MATPAVSVTRTETGFDIVQTATASPSAALGIDTRILSDTTRFYGPAAAAESVEFNYPEGATVSDTQIEVSVSNSLRDYDYTWIGDGVGAEVDYTISAVNTVTSGSVLLSEDVAALNKQLPTVDVVNKTVFMPAAIAFGDATTAVSSEAVIQSANPKQYADFDYFDLGLTSSFTPDIQGSYVRWDLFPQDTIDYTVRYRIDAPSLSENLGAPEIDWDHVAAVVTQHWERTGHWVPYEELAGSPLPESGGEGSPAPVTPDIPSGIPIGTPISLVEIAAALLLLPSFIGGDGDAVEWAGIGAVVTDYWELTGDWVPYEELRSLLLPAAGAGDFA